MFVRINLHFCWTIGCGIIGTLLSFKVSSDFKFLVKKTLKLNSVPKLNYKVVSAKGGYHGHTGLAVATGDVKYRQPFGIAADGFVQVPFGDLEAVKAAMGDDTAAVIL